MLGIYYGIWVDCIVRAKSIPKNKENWAVRCMFFMTFCMAINLVLLMYILQQYLFGYFFYAITMDFLPKQIDYLLNFVLLFYLPCIVLNYLLIFRKRRYETLLNKYPYQNGKLYLIYSTISIFLPIILMWIYW